jgi:hypothetical protein
MDFTFQADRGPEQGGQHKTGRDLDLVPGAAFHHAE